MHIERWESMRWAVGWGVRNACENAWLNDWEINTHTHIWHTHTHTHTNRHTQTGMQKKPSTAAASWNYSISLYNWMQITCCNFLQESKKWSEMNVAHTDTHIYAHTRTRTHARTQIYFAPSGNKNKFEKLILNVLHWKHIVCALASVSRSRLVFFFLPIFFCNPLRPFLTNPLCRLRLAGADFPHA